MNIDTTLTAHQNLVNLIGSVNNVSLKDGSIAFGTPQQTAPAGVESLTPNTSIAVNGNNPDYSGSVNFLYTRVDIKRATASPVFAVELNAQTDNNGSALNLMSAALGLIPGGIKASSAIQFLGGLAAHVEYGVHADPASLLYCGTTLAQVHWNNIPAPAGWGWVQKIGSLNEGPFVIDNNGLFWSVDNFILHAYKITDGTIMAAIDLKAAYGTGGYYVPQFLDSNGVLWLGNSTNYDANSPQIVRVDTNTLAIKDAPIKGNGFSYSQFSYDSVNNAVWSLRAMATSPFTQKLVLLDPTTAQERTVLPLTINPGTIGTCLDTKRGQLWISDYATNNYRIRVLKIDGTVLATPSTSSYQWYLQGNGTGQSQAIYLPSTDEIVIADYDNGPANQYRFSRWSASSMTMSVTANVTNALLDPNVASSVSMAQPYYDPVTDTILVVVNRWDNNNNSFDEIWSVDRATLGNWTVRIPQITRGLPSNLMVDSAGNIYGSFQEYYSWTGGDWFVGKILHA